MKTQEEILNQLYISSQDLKILIPTMGEERCRTYIKEIRKEMEEKKLYVPQTQPLLALTKLVKKKFGF